MAEGKIVLDRIAWVEAPQSRRHLLGHAPVSALQADEADGPPHLLYVGVNGHEELGRRDLNPITEIQMVSADHPPEEEEEALTRATRGGTGKKVEEATGEATARKDRAEILSEESFDEAFQGRPHVGVRLGIALEKIRPERSVSLQDPLEGKAQGSDITGPVEAVAEAPEAIRVPDGIETPDELGGVRAHDCEEALDCPGKEIDAAVGQTGSEKRHHLPVSGILIAARKLNGVMGESSAVVEVAVEFLHGALEAVGSRHNSAQTIAAMRVRTQVSADGGSPIDTRDQAK